MRSDEEFVKDTIVADLPHPPDRVVPGGNKPPDFILHFGSTAIALEVTILSSVIASPDGDISNRRTVDEFLCGLNDSLLEAYSPLVPEGQFVMIHYEGPIKKPNAYQKELKSLVEGRLRTTRFSTAGFETVIIAGNSVQIRQRLTDHPGRKKFVGIISNKHSIVNIAHQAEILLNNAISRKNDILHRLAFPGEKWLGCLNSYFLADAAIYRRVVASSTTTHNFSKVFVVSLDGTVDDIMK